MKKGMLIIFLAICLAAVTSSTCLYASSFPSADERCSAPPFYTTGSEPPNILFVIDKSGSMGWEAYSPSNYKGDEEGYFEPDKIYKYDSSDSTWKEVCRYGPSCRANLPAVDVYTSPTDSNDQCPREIWSGLLYNRNGSNSNGQYTFKGSCLNVHLMTRVDIERWALTGGTPKDCGNVTDPQCDPNFPGNTSCSGGKCVLKPYYSYYGYVEVPETRLDGFIQAADNLTMKPRMGLLFYSKNISVDKVYLGDYPNGENADPTYPFTYLKRFINAKGVGGGTGTVKGMGEAYDYFSQSDTFNYPGGFLHGVGTYKDPLYRCDYDKSNCSPAGWCTKSYVILVSDGQWNTPNCTYESDPVQPAYRMHKETLRTIDGHDYNVDKVYTLGVFMGGTGVRSMKNVAMYGSFDLSTGLSWPSGTTGYPITECNVDDCRTTGSGSSCVEPPGGPASHPDWDADDDGEPDTFFAPQNALDLKLNLFSIFQDIISDVGASASVATVTQDILGEDIVIRGAFRNNPPDQKIWEGHFESYWPVEDCLNARDAANCTAPCTWDPNAGECLPYTFQNEQNITNHAFCSDSDFIGGHCWDAHLKLASQTNRNIFTYINGVKVEISQANLNLLHPYLANDLDFNGDGVINIQDTAQLIRWIRGEWDASWSGEIRPRSGLLGDIVYSAPVVVGEPALSGVPKQIAAESCTAFEPCFQHTTKESCNGDTSNRCSWDWSDNICKGPLCSAFSDNSTLCSNQPTCNWNSSDNKCEEKGEEELCNMDGADSCFYTYRICNRHRKKVAYVGANDGMLHAFTVGVWDSSNEKWQYDPAKDSSIGEELWAYIPSNLLSEIKCLAKYNYGGNGGCQHRTMVDLSSLAWDVNLETPTGTCGGTPAVTCDTYDSNETACRAAGCTWNCSGNFDCGTIQDRTRCDADPGCSWSCSGNFTCANLTQAECNNAPSCTWGRVGGTDSCNALTDFNSCSANSNCNWDCSGTFTCENITDAQECLDAGCSLNGCYWHNDRCDGTFDCTTLNHAECNNRDRLCKWKKNKACTGTVKCFLITDRSACNDSGCTWTDLGGLGYCSGSPSCSGFRKKDCKKIDGCSWDVISQGCEQRGSITCGSLGHRTVCEGYSQGCTGGTKDCSTLSNTDKCTSVSGCTGSCNGQGCTGSGGTCSPDNCFPGCISQCINNSGSADATCSPDFCPSGCTTSCTGSIICSDIKSQTACTAAGCSWTQGTKSPWRTVIVGGERGGGDLYFAIDVTEPDSPTVLWEYSVLRNMVNLQKTSAGQYTALRPYAARSVYDTIKTYPLSWSVPYVGRWALPSTLYFKAEPSLLYPWSPDPSTGLSPVNWGDSSHKLSGWFAFIGGGVRVNDKDDLLPACSTHTIQADCVGDSRCTWDSATGSCGAKMGFDVRDQLFEPFMLVLDIKNGINIFQYTWPILQRAFQDKWDLEKVGDNLIPNSINSAIVLDLWKGTDANGTPLFGQDGKVDHIFAGDLAGTFWGLRVEGTPSDPARLVVDTWKTKKAVPDCSSQSTKETCTAHGCWWDSTISSCKDGYGTRGSRQPITATPSAAFDADKNLRIYFGTGKFETARGTYNDQLDSGKMSFYNITLPLDEYTSTHDDSFCSVSISSLPDVSIACTSSNNAVEVAAGSTDNLKIRLRPHNCASLCTGYSDDWSSPPHPDSETAEYVDATCSGSCPCSSECYSCILDLVEPGERITSQALVAGGLVFFTTFKPNTSVCGGGGDGYLYVVDYMCRRLSKNPLRHSGLASEWLGSGGWSNSSFTGPAKAVRTHLGSGMPSRPVLDSTGEHVLIQTSDARIHRIRIELNYKDLLKGWKQAGQ